MANQFVNLPVPVGNGVGTPVDMSSFGASKSIVVGGNAKAQITIEFNNDAGQAGSWSALKTFQDTGEGVFDVACRWMRVRVSNYNQHAPGTPNVDVGGDDAGTSFQALVAPVGNGNGASVNVSALGIFKTVQVGGAFRGMTIVEVSEDGTDWGQPFAFQTPGFKSLVITASFMRVKRVGVPQVAPGLPVVTVGACEEGGGGAALIIENEGVALVGNPYSTVNFEAGVKADDDAGVARVRGATATAILTYRPGGIGNDAETFTDWPTLYAKLVELRTAAGESGIFQIVFEAQFVENTPQVVIIPSDGETYDMTGVEWIGMFGSADSSLQQIPVRVGDDDQNPLVITHLRKITGLNIGTQQDTAITVNAELDNAGETLTLLNVTVFGDDGKFPITISGPSGKIVLDDNTTLSTSSITTDENYDIDIVGVLKNEDTQSIQADALAGDGIVTVRLKEGSGSIDFDQSGMTNPLAWLSAAASPAKSLAWPFMPCIEIVPADNVASATVGYTNLVPTGGDGESLQLSIPLASSYQKGDFLTIKLVPVVETTPGVVVSNGVDLIDGEAQYVFDGTEYESAIFVSNGVDEWFVVADKLEGGSAAGPSPIPEKWIINSPIAINLAASALETGLSQSFSTYRALRAGSITGLGWRFATAVLAGQITINIRINGGAPIALQGVSTSVSNATGGSSSQAAGVANFVAGDLIDVTITTNGVWAPTDNSLEVDLDAVFAVAA
jgi:hypothetical protein